MMVSLLVGEEEVVPLAVALDAALLEAAVDALGDILGDVLAEALNVLAVERGDTAKGRANHGRVEVEESLSDLLNAGVDIVKAGDEDGIFAVRVEFSMNSPLREDGHLVKRESVGDWRKTVLDDEVSDEAALDDDVELGGAIVDMRSIHAARAEEAEGHGSAVSDERGECASVCSDSEAAEAVRLGARNAPVVEIKNVVAGLIEESDAFLLSGREEQAGDELLVGGTGVDRDNRRKEVIKGRGSGGSGRGFATGHRRGCDGGGSEEKSRSDGGEHVDEVELDE
jgi:hypothetical protein